MKEEPLVSVLTPVYNGETYLRECIESVLAQEYENWEYVILNNQSKDQTLAIAEEYAARDKRVRLIDSDEFLPVIQNFNKAIRQMSPESVYCKFVCADDWLASDCLRKMVAVGEAHSEVGLIGAYRLIQDKVAPEGLPYHRNVFSGPETGRMNLLDGPYTFGAPSALMYRSEIMRKRPAFFNEAHTAADTEACYETLREWDFGFVHQILTFNRVHAQSVTSINSYLNRELVNHIYILKTYGREYLSEVEFQARWKKVMQEYYQFLGGHLGRFKDPDFRAYHNDSMTQMGLSLSWREIAKGASFLGVRRGLDIRQNLKSLQKYGKKYLDGATSAEGKGNSVK